MRLQWVAGVLDDLAEIASYLHHNAPAAAIDILSEIYSSALALQDMPYLGRLEANGSTRRLLVARNYLLQYKIEGDQLALLRLRHTSRRPLG